MSSVNAYTWVKGRSVHTCSVKLKEESFAKMKIFGTLAVAALLIFVESLARRSYRRKYLSPMIKKTPRNQMESSLAEIKTLITRMNRTLNRELEVIKEDVTDRAHEAQTRILLFMRCSRTAPLGLNSGSILDNQLSASSTYRGISTYGPQNARLDKATWPRGWTAGAETGQWLQVDFGRLTVATALATQGYSLDSDFVSAWVRTYILAYSTNGKSWRKYREKGQIKIFKGNTDKNTVVRRDLTHPISTVLLRVYPKTFYNYVAMRLEIYGCFP